jgi:hypothetical protein
MKAPKTITLLLLLVPALATVQAKPKKPYKLPAVFNQAHYVYVEAVGGDEFDPRLHPEDRQAISDVNKALYDWNRYTLTMKREQAELVFVVRKGRAVEVNAGVQVSAGSQGAPNRRANDPTQGNDVGYTVGGEVGPADDLLEVYMPNPGDAHGTLIWQHTLADGLNAPTLALFKQLKDEVERSYPTQTASKP